MLGPPRLGKESRFNLGPPLDDSQRPRRDGPAFDHSRAATVHEHAEELQTVLDRRAHNGVKDDETVPRLMSRARSRRCARHTIDDPSRFRSADVEMGGGYLQNYLFEAASVLRHRTQRWSALGALVIDECDRPKTGSLLSSDSRRLLQEQ